MLSLVAKDWVMGQVGLGGVWSSNPTRTNFAGGVCGVNAPIVLKIMESE